MSTNCMKCVVNKRTGPDLLCDDCRVKSLRERVAKLTKERDYLFDCLVSNTAVFLHDRAGHTKPYADYKKMAEEGIAHDLERIHELEPGETLDGS